ncbi:hypothetical protein JZK55_09510 [Dissulfurispira thermophila]|uniref:DUF4384 domain-containing protein n=1 Tax=Dissulfurispira thermophila TaxID=2715679 RepID=A0A7G1H176_9BACT|nr:DUF4384 domain-containing protein [Dissulfurispira thermophila]BCB96029.1 hypothetical protein JZK55_09510 [Dissulfurispira thermophila]
MKIYLLSFFIIFTSFVNVAYSAQSTITESEGYACMGEDRTKRQTEETAFQDAKRKAVEQVSTYIQSETQVKDFELQKDIVNAYTNAKVRIIESHAKWDNEPPRIGDCYKIKIKAEVIPNEDTMKKISQSKEFDDPSAPLKVQVWTDKKEYESGEKVKIYIKGNKPFYAIVLYNDAKGELLQLLPNPYRKDNYFNGGVVYEIPSGNDRFELEVSPPFGEEKVFVYAATSALGDINVEDIGGVYQVKTRHADIGDRTRGIKLKEKTSNKGMTASEFFEGVVVLKTGGYKK